METNWTPTYVTETSTTDAAITGTGIIRISADVDGVTVERIDPRDFFLWEPDEAIEQRSTLFETLYWSGALFILGMMVYGYFLFFTCAGCAL